MYTTTTTTTTLFPELLPLSKFLYFSKKVAIRFLHNVCTSYVLSSSISFLDDELLHLQIIMMCAFTLDLCSLRSSFCEKEELDTRDTIHD